MNTTHPALLLAVAAWFLLTSPSLAQEKPYPGADESTPSKAQYFSWINNTNEGATEEQTLINLEFFAWLRREFGMQLDIYAFDAGAIDGKRFYGSVESDRFRKQFPDGFGPIHLRAKELGIRLGLWGGPDGFGDTEEETRARIEQMVALCRDHDWALFKFDAVCGPLLPENEDAFITMMRRCREHSPDLILLNHRLGLERAQAYATTFLWEGSETYIDVWSSNSIPAPHPRAAAISRGVPPDLIRLTEDHGVCLSSSLDYWEDDLVLQAFNRSLILAPQLYGNPWLLRDEEFPRLARIFNLHRKYRDILVRGIVLPEAGYGPHAVSRGDERTRLVTLRNLTWEPVTYRIGLDELGLAAGRAREVRRLHPTERVLGSFDPGAEVPVTVDPFRACLLLVSTAPVDLATVKGVDYRVVRAVPGRPVEIDLLGSPGTEARIDVTGSRATSATLDGQPADHLLQGEARVRFPGARLELPPHRRLAIAEEIPVPPDPEWQSLYEATVFSADNDALEVRSLRRSGPTAIPEVEAARRAFFEQEAFTRRGLRGRNLFDGSMETGYWPSRKYRIDQTVRGGCLRLDLGEVIRVDRLVVRVPDIFSLEPLLLDEGNHVEISTDLRSWERLTYLADLEMEIEIGRPVRYLRFRLFPGQVVEVEGFAAGRSLDRSRWRASNLFAHPSRLKIQKAWKAAFPLDEVAPSSALNIALHGRHGVEGAYASVRIDGKLVGAPGRSRAYPSNTWEYVNSRIDRNYTYRVPLDERATGKPVEVFVLGFDERHQDIRPEIWISAYPAPHVKRRLVLSGDR